MCKREIKSQQQFIRMLKQDHLQNIKVLLLKAPEVLYDPQQSTQYQDIVSITTGYWVTPEQIYSLSCIALKLRSLIAISFKHKSQIVQQVCKIKTLETLGVQLTDFFKHNVANDHLVNISKLSHIKNLILHGYSLGIQDYKLLATMNQLVTLQLHEYCQFFDSQKIILLGSLKNIKSFAFIQSQQSRFGQQIKIFIQTFPFLEQLKIVHTSLQPEHLVGLLNLTKLRHLNLNYTCEQQTEQQQQQILKIIRQLKRLETLQLAWYLISADDLSYWKQNFHYLRNLNLEGCTIDNNKLNILSQMNNIVDLNIKISQIRALEFQNFVSNNNNFIKLTVSLENQDQLKCIISIGKFLLKLQFLMIHFLYSRQLFINNGLIYLKALKNMKNLTLNLQIDKSHNISSCIRNYKHIRKIEILTSKHKITKQTKQNININKYLFN